MATRPHSQSKFAPLAGKRQHPCPISCSRPSGHVASLTMTTRFKRAAGLGGRATTDATAAYAARFQSRFAEDFYRTLAGRLTVSSIGIGTYLGECDDADDDRYATAVGHALAHGINLIDTAINYRCQRSERAVGRALREAVDSGIAAREEIVLCTKGGYIPLDGQAPRDRGEYDAYLATEYFERGIMTPEDVVAGGHCLAPGYLASQVVRSRENLAVEAIDVYYLHNPEQQLEALDRNAFLDRMRAAFTFLEERARQREIGAFGCATWNGFRALPGTRGHLDLATLVDIARETGGPGHHFRVIQLPISLMMTEAVRVPTQRLPDGRVVPLLHAAAELGVSVVASASLLQAQLASGLPAQLHEAFPELSTDAQRALAFVRGLPLSAALVGMRSAAHIDENLGAGR